MAKKGVKKNNDKISSLLIENFINLQKALTNNAEKFEELSKQISKLLQLFEISAKTFVEKVDEKVGNIEKDAEFLNKLNSLVEQNKLIAKGLTLMEESLRSRIYGQAPQQQRMAPQPMQQPRLQSSISQEDKKQQSTF